ncbi:MAG: hypothetical protein AAF729_01080, partial [Pseudomonadota bacterium]
MAKLSEPKAALSHNRVFHSSEYAQRSGPSKRTFLAMNLSVTISDYPVVNESRLIFSDCWDLKSGKTAPWPKQTCKTKPPPFEKSV